MIAYHGYESTKLAYLNRVGEHRQADELIQGTGWENGRGCAVGCTLEKYSHKAYEEELGIPEVLAHLEDRIFEGLPKNDAMEWPLAFLDSIRVGADLSGVWPRFAVWLLTEECPSEHGTRVAKLYERRLAGDEPTREEWRSAADAAAYAAYAYAAAGAYAAADAAAYAAYAAADAAYADDAAYAADAAAPARAARRGSYRRQADQLLKLLRSAPVAGGPEGDR